MTICKYEVGPGRNCGSFAFNLHKEGIDQGRLCDVHYWQTRCQRQAAEIEALRADAERYRWLRDPCSGAENAVMYGRGDFGSGLMSGSMMDDAIDDSNEGKIMNELTELELLQLAAKAASIELSPLCTRWDDAKAEMVYWNPLTDDSDALRLAVTLKLATDYTTSGIYAGTDPDNEDKDWVHEFYNGDPYAATRRAIVIAAAEIGRSVK